MKRKQKILIIVMVFLCIIGGISLMPTKSKEIKQETLYLNENKQHRSDFQGIVEEAYDLLKTKGTQSQEIWPDYHLSDNAIVVCERDDQSNQVIHAWELTTKQLRVLSNEDLRDIEIPAAGSYSGIQFEGKDAMIIALNHTVVPSLEKVAISNYIFEIGTHEMVHFHYESMIKLIKLSLEQKMHGGRGTDYPKDALPRVYRKMLYDNLVYAFINPQEKEKYLGQAKYWNEKWKSEYSNEYYQAKITDIMEGKARYIQYMLCLSNDLSQEEKNEWIISHFDLSLEPSISIDKESYKLGFVAGVLLDQMDIDWKREINKHPQSPVEVLLKDIPMIEEYNTSFEEKLVISKQQMNQVNKEIETKIENIQQAENDHSIPYLILDAQYLAGSFETTDFINVNEKKVTVDFGGTFENEKGKIIIKQTSVIEKNSLLKDTYQLPLVMNYQIVDDVLIINTDEITCHIQVNQSKDKTGRMFFTMK